VPGSHRGVIDEKEVERAKRAALVLEMRREGMTYEAIGEAVGIAKQNASKIVKNALAKVEIAPALELLKLETERLDELQAVFYPKAIKGDVFAADRVLAIMDRRAKLLGLNAPEKKADEEAAAGATRVLDQLAATLDKMADRLHGPGPLIDITPQAPAIEFQPDPEDDDALDGPAETDERAPR
jgi:predicted transcriptional regulator